MKISIFTPTHNPQYLQETYDSLLNQTYVNWEWVVVTNGASVDDIYHTVRKMTVEDERVTVNKAPSNCYTDSSRSGCNIGTLKNHCVSLCTGEYVLELDHDDLLSPDALFEIVSMISIDNPDFIYSDFCEFRSDGSCNVYDSKFSWNNYEFYSEILPGKPPYTAMMAQEISPRALYEIFYAPNHVRVWKKDFYDRIGGHDVTMKVCDDHDLLCRTYLAGGNMQCIHQPLYFYRLQDDNKNSYLVHNDLVQTTQRQVGNKYFYRMVEKWADDNELIKLDLGGAHNPKEGYQSLDIMDGVDIQCDVTKGIPLPDNSVGCIRAYDFFEHIPNQGYELYYPEIIINNVEHVQMQPELKNMNPWIDLLNEMYRVLAPGGWILSATPIGNTNSYMEDPTHVNPLCEESFKRLNNKDKLAYNPDLKARFQDTRVWTHGDYVFADLQCLKGQNTSGYVGV